MTVSAPPDKTTPTGDQVDRAIRGITDRQGWRDISLPDGPEGLQYLGNHQFISLFLDALSRSLEGASLHKIVVGRANLPNPSHNPCYLVGFYLLYQDTVFTKDGKTTVDEAVALMSDQPLYANGTTVEIKPNPSEVGGSHLYAAVYEMIEDERRQQQAEDLAAAAPQIRARAFGRRI